MITKKQKKLSGTNVSDHDIQKIPANDYCYTISFLCKAISFWRALTETFEFQFKFCWDFKSCRSQSRKLSLTKPKNRLSSQSNNFLTSFFVAQINLCCHNKIQKKYYIKYSLCLHMLFLSPLLISLFKVPSHTWMQKGVVHTM